ncbi:DUF7093 family protein [Halegenticoccus soli]|uniref:DUF7093 family protein n=1 Tax=Halegenticoccus soli TaxID=1985678 RepID=UPI000C6E8D04|nr:hypothetical protein [Halegenticoccus soli]
MGLRCLFGHDFGDPEIEREREEQGKEMVVTVREVETCRRCGERRIVSENKEVTAVASRDAGSAEGATAEGQIGDAAEGPIGESPERPAGGAPESSVEGPPESSAEDAPESSAEEPPGRADDPVDGMPTHPAMKASTDDGGDAEDFAAMTAEEDDGVILDETDESTRRPGEWPDAGDVGRRDDRAPTLEEVEASMGDARGDSGRAGAAPESGTDDAPAPWPEPTGEDEGFAAEVSDGSVTDVSFGGLAPEIARDEGGDEAVEEGDDAEFVGHAADRGDRAEGVDEGFARVDDPSVDSQTPPEVSTEYYCPACEMTRDAASSSMRAGDICPECRKGYVTERER